MAENKELSTRDRIDPKNASKQLSSSRGGGFFSSIWRFLQAVWTKALKPLIGGVIYGMGSMLGVVLVRYIVMEQLGIVPYKEFEAPAVKAARLQAAA